MLQGRLSSPLATYFFLLVHQSQAFLATAPYRSRSSISTTALPCQLLGMNSKQPTEFSLSWSGFCQRGGGTDIHADGWGLSYYQGQGLRQFHDTEAASQSPLALFLSEQRIRTKNMLAHIRYATKGSVDLTNVHPFTREMWGINWSMAHNGEIPLFTEQPNEWIGDVAGERVYFPIGETDSESFFCAMLNALRAQFTDTMPSLPVLYDSIQKLCVQVVEYNKSGTILNFLLTCGPHVLWVYSWPGKRPGSKVWNGLWYKVSSSDIDLCDDDYVVDISVQGTGNDQLCVVATKPLTDDERWVELQPGELILLDEGLPYVSARDLFHVELQGHGLETRVLLPPRLEEDMRQYEFDYEFYAGVAI